MNNNIILEVNNLKQHFPHLVAAKHILAMHFAKAEQPIGSHLRLEFTARHGDSDVVDKQKSGNLRGVHSTTLSLEPLS